MRRIGPVIAALTLWACGSRSVDLGPPPGSLGGVCLEPRTCDLGLECFRGICLEPDISMDGGWSPPPMTGRDAGVGPGRVDSGRPPPPPVGAGVVASGTGLLVAVFPVGAGLIVVDHELVRLLSREGTELARFTTGREITAAAFDGTYLGIADRAQLTSLRPDLTMVATGLLTRYCASAVVVSGDRFVCGPENDWDRVFATHDLTTAAELGVSSEYTYNGIPMRRVPGTDHFVTVTVGTSPSDFHLYTVGADDLATFINESPYHGDFAATQVFAFHGMPATHLVNSQGVMLRILGEGCAPGSTFTSTCFVRDGDLGTLAVGETYHAMTEDGAGSIYALRDESDPWSSLDPFCDGSCTISRIDSAARTVVSSRAYADELVAIPVFEHDAWSSQVVLGVQTEGDRFDGYSAYEVRLAPYE